MNTTTATYTPWGWTRDIEDLAEGVWRVTTPGHGGLKLSRERWEELPGEIRDTMLTETYAEEDCEEPIVRTLLGVGGDRERELAVKIAGYFDRYAPALPFLLNRTVSVKVTAEHIAVGRKDSLSCCPIALGLCDAIEGIVEIEVECSRIWWRDEQGWAYSVEPPEAVSQWILALDYGTGPVEPFEFELAPTATVHRKGRRP